MKVSLRVSAQGHKVRNVTSILCCAKGCTDVAQPVNDMSCDELWE